jgi:hypothetical protein
MFFLGSKEIGVDTKQSIIDELGVEPYVSPIQDWEKRMEEMLKEEPSMYVSPGFDPSKLPAVPPKPTTKPPEGTEWVLETRKGMPTWVWKPVSAIMPTLPSAPPGLAKKLPKWVIPVAVIAGIVLLLRR